MAVGERRAHSRSVERVGLDRWCERGILAAVLSILVLMPLAFGGRPQPPVGSAFDAVVVEPFLIAEVLTLVVAILWGIRLLANPRPKLLWPPICWAVVAFVIYALFRYFTADIEYVARQEVLRVLVYAVLFFAVLNNLHKQELTQTVAFTLIFLAMVLSCYAVYQFLTESPRVWYLNSPYWKRGSGTFISPNHLGGFLELLLPLALAYTLASRLKPLGKVFVGYAAVVILVGVAVTVSRGSWISTGMALLLFFGVFLLHQNHRLPAFALLMVLLAGTAMLAPKSQQFAGRWKRLLVGGKVDDDSRFTLWRPAVRVWQDNLWFGAGPAHFDYRFRKYRPEDFQLQPDRAHNDYLNTLADWGIVGAALVATAWGLLFVGVARTWRYVGSGASDFGGKRNSNKFAFVIGATFGLVAILFHSVVDFNMHIPANALVVVTLMALLTSHVRFATERYWLTLRLPAKAVAAAMLFCSVLYLGAQSWRQGTQSYWLARAARTPNFSPARIALLEKAFAAEPRNSEIAYAIGECYRAQSKEGGEDYKELSAQALSWFERCRTLNPIDPYGFLRYGMCLDWMGRQAESPPYFDRAEELDPNGYFTVANIGLHYVQIKNFAAARPWFERSLHLQWETNVIARSYLGIINRELLEAATNEPSGKIELPSHLR